MRDRRHFVLCVIGGLAVCLIWGAPLFAQSSADLLRQTLAGDLGFSGDHVIVGDAGDGDVTVVLDPSANRRIGMTRPLTFSPVGRRDDGVWLAAPLTEAGLQQLPDRTPVLSIGDGWIEIKIEETARQVTNLGASLLDTTLNNLDGSLAGKVTSTSFTIDRLNNSGTGRIDVVADGLVLARPLAGLPELSGPLAVRTSIDWRNGDRRVVDAFAKATQIAQARGAGAGFRDLVNQLGAIGTEVTVQELSFASDLLSFAADGDFRFDSQSRSGAVGKGVIRVDGIGSAIRALAPRAFDSAAAAQAVTALTILSLGADRDDQGRQIYAVELNEAGEILANGIDVAPLIGLLRGR